MRYPVRIDEARTRGRSDVRIFTRIAGRGNVARCVASAPKKQSAISDHDARLLGGQHSEAWSRS